jgi:hypothetical protein
MASSSGGDADQQWWYCLRHERVEQGASCPATDRMGPYADEAGARQALAGASQRTEAWDEDPLWKDD